jgi:hypothetical protein
MQLFLIICFSLFLAALGGEVQMIVIVSDSEISQSTCSSIDFAFLEASMKDSITFWANHYLSSIGGNEDFVITSFERVTTRQLVLHENAEQEDSAAVADGVLLEEEDQTTTRMHDSRQLLVSFTFKAKAFCRLCTPDNLDRHLRSLALKWGRKNMSDSINKKLTQDVQKFIKENATDKSCFKTAGAFSATFAIQ